ncbi:RNA cap guanine-N2 methyltransferase [Aureococcus anophagefferens]|nr:RNA cap guanine-N2 methyltransferase [Aureococcus anophagefferens]
MDKTLFANLKLSDGREAQARELLDDKIHRLGGAAPYLSAANDDLIQEVAADLAEAKRCLAEARAPSLRRLLEASAQAASRELKLLNGDAAPAPAVDVAPAAGDVAALAAELAEAKRLLARASRPAVKKLAASFVRKTAARELELLNGDGGAPAAAATKLPDAAPPRGRSRGPRPSSRRRPRGSSPSQRAAGADDDARASSPSTAACPWTRACASPARRKLEALMAKIDLTKPPGGAGRRAAAPPRAAPERPPSEGLKKVAAQAPAVVRAPAVPKDVEFSYNPTASPAGTPRGGAGDADARGGAGEAGRGAPSPAAAADRATAAERSAAAEKAVRRAAPPAGTAGEAVAARADEPAAAAATEAEEAAPAARYALKKNRDAVAGEMLRDLEAMKGAAAEAIYVEGIAAGRDAEASEARARAEAKAAEERAAAFHRGGAGRRPSPRPSPRRRPGGAGRPGPTLRGIRRRQRRRGLLPAAAAGGGGGAAEDRDAAPAAEGPVFTPITKFGWDQGDEHSASWACAAPTTG